MTLDEYLKSAADAMARDPQTPCMSLFVDEESGTVELICNPSVRTYSEWIPGEGADIGLTRDIDTGKVVGCCLPLQHPRLIVGRNSDDDES